MDFFKFYYFFKYPKKKFAELFKTTRDYSYAKRQLQLQYTAVAAVERGFQGIFQKFRELRDSYVFTIIYEDILKRLATFFFVSHLYCTICPSGWKAIFQVFSLIFSFIPLSLRESVLYYWPAALALVPVFILVGSFIMVAFFCYDIRKNSFLTVLISGFIFWVQTMIIVCALSLVIFYPEIFVCAQYLVFFGKFTSGL